ncbi:cadherin-related family member 4-like isoform X2 [Erpetoichthys calabaricus]|uniref:cadherin-related family member 4-like isoform X2 n=1 Tax=Erpetoichthys calabaricus TaxID=27687 RepID=UPI002234043D|nr:cadherin-related family member 4-like isoform X2 [Erpetoichthys calabaricus]
MKHLSVHSPTSLQEKPMLQLMKTIQFLMWSTLFKQQTKMLSMVINSVIQSQVSTSSACQSVFTINRNTGVVYRSPGTVLDYDAGCQRFLLKMQVNDTGSLSCEGTVEIIINNLNDEVPVFTHFPSDTLNVSETTLSGTVLNTVVATDRDGDVVTFSLYNPTGQVVFGLDNRSGDIILLQPLSFDDPDKPKQYLLPILGYDNQFVHTSTYTVTVNVQNVNNPPSCDPDFSSASGVTTSIPENFPIFSSVYMILAKDPDPGDTVHFSVITAAPQNTTYYFALDTTDGIITRTSALLDFESSPVKYKITISAFEVGKANPKSCTGVLTIDVSNVNDEAPIFMNIPSAHLNIYENSLATVYQLTAVDRDIGDRVYYEFCSLFTGLKIDEDTGRISPQYPLDYEDLRTPHQQIIEVRAYDRNRIHSTTATLTVDLINVNDNSPQCTEDLIAVEYAETVSVGTLVVALDCMDLDMNLLTYNMILDSYSSNRFTLTQNEITVGPGNLNYDDTIFAGMQFKHTIIVKVTDDGIPSLTSTATLFVKVTRVNEVSPSAVTNSFFVSESSPPGTFVGAVVFQDQDWPFNNVKYTLVGGSNYAESKFFIESNTGKLRVFGNLDRETTSQFAITVQAVDLDNDIKPDPMNQKTSLAVVTVYVTNVNDEPPVCNPAHYEKVIYSTILTSFLQLSCSDNDSPDNQLDFTIVGGNVNSRFVLQRPTTNPPSVATSQSFQYGVFQGIEDPTDFELLIKVTDELGGNRALQLTTTATVIIHVVPWSTTKPSTATPTTTVTTEILERPRYYWAPQGWFTAAIVITAFLFFMCLYLLAWCILKDVPRCAMFFPNWKGTMKKPNKNVLRFQGPVPRQSNKNTSESIPFKEGSTNPFVNYDVRGVDPATGQSYLFNSKTGDIHLLS